MGEQVSGGVSARTQQTGAGLRVRPNIACLEASYNGLDDEAR